MISDITVAHQIQSGFWHFCYLAFAALWLISCTDTLSEPLELEQYDAKVAAIFAQIPDEWQRTFADYDINAISFCETSIDSFEQASNTLELMLVVIHKEGLLRRKTDYDMRTLIETTHRSIPDPRLREVREAMNAGCVQRQWINRTINSLREYSPFQGWSESAE